MKLIRENCLRLKFSAVTKSSLGKKQFGYSLRQPFALWFLQKMNKTQNCNKNKVAQNITIPIEKQVNPIDQKISFDPKAGTKCF
jgi:hypothetical protein